MKGNQDSFFNILETMYRFFGWLFSLKAALVYVTGAVFIF
jgi:hypothetical protein